MTRIVDKKTTRDRIVEIAPDLDPRFRDKILERRTGEVGTGLLDTPKGLPKIRGIGIEGPGEALSIRIGGALWSPAENLMGRKEGVPKILNDNFRLSLTAPFQTAEDVRILLEEGASVSPLLARLDAILTERPELLDKIFVVDAEESFSERSGESILDRNIEGETIQLGRGANVFVVVHELGHFLPMDVLRGVLGLPEDIVLPEVDPNADIVTIAYTILMRRFIEEEIAGFFEIQLAQELVVAGYPADIVPDFVWEEKELFDKDRGVFQRSFAYLGDNHKTIYSIETAFQIAQMIKEDPSEFKKIKFKGSEIGDVKGLSVTDLRSLIKEHQEDIKKLMQLVGDFLSRDYRKFAGDVAKFKEMPEELHDAVVVAGTIMRRMEMAISRALGSNESGDLAVEMGAILRVMNGERLAKLVRMAIDFIGADPDFRSIKEIGQLLFAKGYKLLGESIYKRPDFNKALGAEDSFLSPFEYRLLTGAEFPHEKITALMEDIKNNKVTERGDLFTRIKEINELVVIFQRSGIGRFEKSAEGDEDGRKIVVEGTGILYLALTVFKEPDDKEREGLEKLLKFLSAPNPRLEKSSDSFSRKMLNDIIDSKFADVNNGLRNSYIDPYQNTEKIVYSVLFIFALDQMRNTPSSEGKRELINSFAHIYYSNFEDFQIFDDCPQFLRHLMSDTWGDGRREMIEAFMLAYAGDGEMAVKLYAAGFVKMTSGHDKMDEYMAKALTDFFVTEKKLASPELSRTIELANEPPTVAYHPSLDIKTRRGLVPDGKTSMTDELGTFLEGWGQSINIGQPIEIDIFQIGVLVEELGLRNDLPGRNVLIVEIFEKLFMHISQFESAKMSVEMWADKVGRTQTLSQEDKDQLFLLAVDTLLPAPGGGCLAPGGIEIMRAIELSRTVLNKDYPFARRLFLKRLAEYIERSSVEVGGAISAAFGEVVNRLFLPLVNLHPEIVSAFFFEDFKKLGNKEDTFYVNSLNAIFGDMVEILDHSEDIMKWDSSLMASGTMSDVDVEARLIAEVSENVHNGNYPLARAKRLEDLLATFIRYRLQEYETEIEELARKGKILSSEDLKEIPFLSYLFFSIDQADVTNAYADSPLADQVENIVSPGLWDHLEDGETLTPVKRAVLRAVLESRSITIAKAKTPICLEVIASENLEIGFRQLAIETILRGGIVDQYSLNYYESIKGDEEKLVAFGEFISRQIDIAGEAILSAYLLEGLRRFKRLGKEEEFWAAYKKIVETGPKGIKLSESVAYLYVIPARSDAKTNALESFEDSTQFYLDLKAILKLANTEGTSRLDVRNALDNFAGIYSMDGRSLNLLRPKAKEWEKNVDDALGFYLNTRRAKREAEAKLPEQAKGLPDVIRFLFVETWLSMNPLERVRLGKALQKESVSKDDQVGLIKELLYQQKLEKLGQMIFMMYGIVPEEWRARFGETLEKNQPASFFEVRDVVKKQFGAPIEDLYSEFDEQPIAVGSIAQVHRAVTKAGILVAVKVIIPAREAMVRDSMKSLEKAVTAFQISERLFDMPLDLAEFFKWFDSSMEPEFDLRIEAKNSELFGKLAGTDIRTPKIHRVTEKVMEMEFVKTSGDRINKSDLPVVIRAVIRGVFGGAVHDDPHAGNISGRTLFDFGRIEILTVKEREDLVALMMGIYLCREGSESAINDLVGALKSLGVEKIDGTLATLSSYLRSAEFRERPLDGDMITSILQKAGQDGLVLKPKIYGVMKALITLDSLGRQTIGPEFSIADILMEVGSEFENGFEEVAPLSEKKHKRE